MSLSRMNVEEPASYLVGQAIRQHLEDRSADGSGMNVVIADTELRRWVRRHLTHEEWAHLEKDWSLNETLAWVEPVPGDSEPPFEPPP